MALHRPAARRPRRRRRGRSGGPDGLLFRRLRRRHLEDRWTAASIWRCVSDGFMGSAAVGAIAVAPSDPNVIYAGTGETEIRLDVSYGDGIYKSTDAGRTWSHVGLQERKIIGRICIHPHESRHRLCRRARRHIRSQRRARRLPHAAMAARAGRRCSIAAPMPGAIELSMDPQQSAHPVRRLLADAPQLLEHIERRAGQRPVPLARMAAIPGRRFRARPACRTACSASSASRLAGALGPRLGAGRDGRATRPASTAPTTTAGAGSQVSSNRDLMHRPWYYTHVFADTRDADTVYVTNLQMWKSTDGGASFTEINTPPRRQPRPVDRPRRPQPHDRGQRWRRLRLVQRRRDLVDDLQPADRAVLSHRHRQPVSLPRLRHAAGQHLDRRPVRDRTGARSRSATAPIRAPAKAASSPSIRSDHNIVYVGAVGSSPGGAGALQRYDYRTRADPARQCVARGIDGHRAEGPQVPLRLDLPDRLLAARQRRALCRRQPRVPHPRRGHELGADLAGPQPERRRARQGHRAATITRESAGAEVHATCACVVESPHRNGEIWASTDDGLVHVTRDDGKTWKNVTPPAACPSSPMSAASRSRRTIPTRSMSRRRATSSRTTSPTCSAAATAGGAGSRSTAICPTNEITRVVRADPVAKGLLFVGTETGIHFSLDDGASWARMPGGLPWCRSTT